MAIWPFEDSERIHELLSNEGVGSQGMGKGVRAHGAHATTLVHRCVLDNLAIRLSQ